MTCWKAWHEMFFIYLFSITIAVVIVGMKLIDNDRIYRWWTIGQFIRWEERRNARVPRLHHLKYMR